MANNIGHILKQTRISRGLSISDVERYLGVKAKYIIAIEEGDPHDILKYIYLPGCIKSYASMLNIPYEELDEENYDPEDYRDLNFNEDLSFPKLNFKFLYFLLPIIVILIIYFVLEQDKSKTEQHNYIQTKEKSKKTQSFSKAYILLAKNAATITIIDDEVTKDVVLKEGDVYFYKNKANKKISTQEPEYIEVFEDNDSNKFIGSLNQVDFFLQRD